MKAAVTGHSEGLGKAIAARLARDGHEVCGFSLDNGYDISTPDGFRRVVNEALDCDVFVNCAHDQKHHGIGQVNILTKLFYHWQDEEKHIISIGSNAPDNYFRESVPHAARYRASKAALDAASLEISLMEKPCRVSIIRPNWINSPSAERREREAGVKLAKLEYDEVADVVAMIIDQGPKITISSITLTRTIRRSEPSPERAPRGDEARAEPRGWWRRPW